VFYLNSAYESDHLRQIALTVIVVKAFLFGSYSSNEANPDSDIDVMVISPVFDIHDDKIKAKAWLLTEEEYLLP